MGLCNGPGAAFSDGAVEPALSPHLFMRTPVSLAHFGGAKSWNWQSFWL